MIDKILYPGSLHNHTCYSNFRLKDSTNTVTGLIQTAIDLNHKVLAFTEHETIAEFIEVEEEAEKVKDQLKVIRGNEIYLTRTGMTKENYEAKKDGYWHFILLAKDAIGNQQIRELSTRAWLRSWKRGRMRRVPTYYEDLKEIISVNKGHVIGSTACLGGYLDVLLMRQAQTPDIEARKDFDIEIENWLNMMKSIFADGDFYLELQPSNTDEQIYCNKKLIELGKKYNLPCIITTDSHYARPENRNAHRAFLKSQDGDREVDEFYSGTYMMNDKEVHDYLNYIDEEDIQKAYQNIIEIADKCENYSLKKPLKIPELDWVQPKIDNTKLGELLVFYKQDIPELWKFAHSEFKSDKLLAALILERLNEHKEWQTKKYYNEINACLEDTRISSEVNNVHWSAYYLNMMKIVDGIWAAGSLEGPGRGSAAGFLLLYILGIIQIDPIRETSPLFRWRFINPERVSVMDIDIDCERGRRQAVLNKFRELYGEDRVANVLTLRTETSKSAIQSACRGLGVNSDEAAYLSGMIEADRGQQRTLHQTFYGDEKKSIKPNRQFVNEMTHNYPEVWEIAQQIEGLISGYGQHAGGVIFVDESFMNTTALMRAPSGEIMVQFDLHKAEECGLIKYDILSIDALDKIHNTIDLLCDYGYAERKSTLKETYENIIGVYNLERDDPKMWKLLWNHEINSMFQMEKQSGMQGIDMIHPKSVDELAILNSVIRLMPQKKGDITPLEKWKNYRKDITLWYDEMMDNNLSDEEMNWLKNSQFLTDGLCITQEDLMSLTMAPELGGNPLSFADKARKVIGKKQMDKVDDLHKEFIDNAINSGCSSALANYVWDYLFSIQMGYSFNRAHTISYSIVGLQEMNLAYRYPIIFWNTGCLIADAGVNNNEENERNEVEDKKASTNYGKMASAIGKFQSAGIKIAPPNINTSNYTFTPDVDKNEIKFGLRGITRISDDLINQIFEQRPFKNIEDFLSKVKINKPQMYNLIKSGAFDEIENIDREGIIQEYSYSIADVKKTLDMRNALSLVRKGLLKGYGIDFECAVVMLDAYLKKKQFKDGNLRLVDKDAFTFFERHLDVDKLIPYKSAVGEWAIDGDKWRVYKNTLLVKMKKVIKDNKNDLLEALNQIAVDEVEEKYTTGTISAWEMDALSCYIHNHELANVNYQDYGLVNFFDLPDNPEIDRLWTIKGRQVPIFKIERIAGTVLDRDKLKNQVSLLTREGVVSVKIYGDAFGKYDRQLSEVGKDGKKHVIEKSWFGRGEKIICTGIKRENMFFAKKYKNTPFHLVEKITNISSDGTLTTQKERAGMGDMEEN